jgi:hypothetical protein
VWVASTEEEGDGAEAIALFSDRIDYGSQGSETESACEQENIIAFEGIDRPRVSERASHAEGFTWVELCDSVGNTAYGANGMKEAPLLRMLDCQWLQRVGWRVRAAMADSDFAGTGQV